jgi:acetoin utilization deacetylase AcuC-like enzyme
MNRIPVFFRPEMTASSRFFAPGTFKPAACVADWQSHGLPIDVRDFMPATRDDFCLAHESGYVDGVLGCRIDNGFGGRQADVAASLPYTTGAMVAAAEEALLSGSVACAPVSGFHHAGWDHGGGFCTFNGLVVTAARLMESGYARRVGILDLDQHYGDGTDDILQRRGLSKIRHFTAGMSHSSADEAEPFLASLARRVRQFADCQVLLYQAGADPHVDDPLGGWMTSEQLERRDRIVFETAAEMRLPVAWNLAGGYQRDANGGIEPVLGIHRRTMKACADVFCDALHKNSEL